MGRSSVRWAERLLAHVHAPAGEDQLRRTVKLRSRQRASWVLVVALSAWWLAGSRLFGDPVDAQALHRALSVAVVALVVMAAPAAAPTRLRTAMLVPRRWGDLVPGWARWLPLVALAPWITALLLLRDGVGSNYVVTTGGWMAIGALLAHLLLVAVHVRRPLSGEDEAAVRLERALRSSAMSYNAGALVAFFLVQLAGLCWLSGAESGVGALDLAGAALAAGAVGLLVALLWMPLAWQLPGDLRASRVPVT